MVQTTSRKAPSAQKVSAPATVQAQPLPPAVSSLSSESKRRAGSSSSKPAKRPKLSSESSLISPEPKGKGIDQSVELSTVTPIVIERDLDDDDDYELDEEAQAVLDAQLDKLEEDLASKDEFREKRRQLVGEVALEMGLPNNFMDFDQNAPWLTYLLGAVSLYIGMKARILAFANRYSYSSL